MPSPLNPDEALQRARELQESRLAIIDELAKANVALVQTREQVARIEGEYSRSYTAAIAAGWTGAELSRIGFAEAAKAPRAKRQPRRQNTSAEDSPTE